MSVQIASIQLNSQTNIDANLDIIKRACTEAAVRADVIVLPENMCVMGRQGELALRFDEMVCELSALAKQCGVYILAGTLPCAVRADGTPTTQDKYRQTSLLFDPQGVQVARYDKIHLFRATVDDSTGSYDEGKTFEAGERLVVAPMNIKGETVHLGMMICFDARFPAMAQRLRQMGADIISVPAAFTYRTGQAHWQLLLQARALDSQCLMIGSAQGGTHRIGTSTRETWGHSMMVDAQGQIIAHSEQTETGEQGYLVIYGEFDKAKQTKIRQSMPIFDCHRLG
ncbi:carbon-nitrogen hydrolase family protein [Moraxella nasibovis]|uniref:nitrilase-related carbon-nitrogen hydrolase n=1 Tax=Moraxella nasibovis TaxID=2904120 RepID=UPI00240EBAB1|nr:nitrilase-related carbon-nitrogen hydrolase [Moraxella nasibovis]WFF38070.1 carbon-nitrogen hydrolase family protein [Moraxella nasibovis]